MAENRKEVLEAITDLENEKNSLEQILYIKKREIRNLKNLLSQNEEFVKRIESMNIIIEYKGENIIVDKYKLKGYSFNNDILKMRKTELEIETKKIEKEIVYDINKPEEAGIKLAESVLISGGDKILEEIYK